MGSQNISDKANIGLYSFMLAGFILKAPCRNVPLFCLLPRVHIVSVQKPWMKELKGIIHRGEGAFLRCPVSTSVQFSLRDEGSTEYMCVRGKITGDNIYRCQSACPVVLNDFDLFKENITSQSL
jgi:hypothetical protein